MNHTVDGDLAKKLKNQFYNNEIAQKFFRWAAGRGRDRRETPIRRLIADTGMDRSDAVDLLKELEALDCGQFIVGRRGKETRMRWEYSLRSIGAAGLGQASEVEELSEELATDFDDEWDMAESDEFISHRFVVRPEITIDIRLPKDITSREAERLATFIRSLPFG